MGTHLVTGGAGFIGSHIATALAEHFKTSTTLSEGQRQDFGNFVESMTQAIAQREASLNTLNGKELKQAQEQIATALAAQRITQLRNIVDAETKRRTAEQFGREHVRMYGVPQLAENVEFLKTFLDHCGVARESKK